MTAPVCTQCGLEPGKVRAGHCDLCAPAPAPVLSIGSRCGRCNLRFDLASVPEHVCLTAPYRARIERIDRGTSKTAAAIAAAKAYGPPDLSDEEAADKTVQGLIELGRYMRQTTDRDRAVAMRRNQVGRSVFAAGLGYDLEYEDAVLLGVWPEVDPTTVSVPPAVQARLLSRRIALAVQSPVVYGGEVTAAGAVVCCLDLLCRVHDLPRDDRFEVIQRFWTWWPTSTGYDLAGAVERCRVALAHWLAHRTRGQRLDWTAQGRPWSLPTASGPGAA